MKKTSYPEFLDAVAGDHVPNDLDLAPIIIDRIQKGKSFRMQPKTKLVTTILLVAIAFVALFYTVPAVKAAIQRWFGYVPDVGLVHDGQIRVLAEPVSVTRENITVTVEQVVINEEGSVLIYSVEAIPAAAQDAPADEGICSTGARPYIVSLRLPGGSPLLASPEGVESWSSGYRHRFNYPPMSSDVDDATLVISCLFHTLTGTVPEIWEIPLHFVPAPADMTAFPVIEIPTSTAPAIANSSDANAVENTALRLTLERAVQLDDGYLLYATLHWEDTPFHYVELLDQAETLRLLDGSGQEILYEIHEDEQTGVNWNQRQTHFAIKTAPVQSRDPLTLELDAVLVGLPVNDSFVFDPGPNPQPGQQWQPNVELTFGEHRMLVHSITVEQSGDGYSIEMTSNTGILKSGLVDHEHPIVSGYDGISAEGMFYNGFYYFNGLPEGPITLSVGDIGVKHIQKLQVQWTPPAPSSTILPTQPTACLSAQTWQARLSQPLAIPAGLSNKILTYGPIDQSNINGPWEVAIVNLNGSQRQPIAEVKGAISPDGTRFAYSLNNAGIQIKDLASGSVTPVPGTTGSYPGLFWTPNGKSIVFSQIGSFDLFMVNPDGSGLRQLTFGGYHELPIGWLSDGSLLYGQYEAEDQYVVYRFNLQSGESQEFSREDIQSISPDGRYLAIGKLTFGERWQLTIGDLDGQNRWSLNDGNPSIIFPRWSPDGQWIIVAVLDPGAGATMHALINLRTCEAIPLPHLQDDVLTWLP
jgi:hypothetical protein